jgi:ribose transport system substrate-binding protein
MKKINLRIFIVIGLIFVFVFSFFCKGDQPDKRKIAFVVTTLGNPFFVDMTEAAKEEIERHPDFELIIHAPERGTGEDIERQLQIIESLIAQKVNLINVVPADSKGIISVILKANEADIPILIIDNKIDRDLAIERGAKTAGFIGSDNYMGGQLAAEYIIKKLNYEGNVAILEGVSGVDAAIDRKQGFIDYVKEYEGINVVASLPADWSREKGLNVTQNVLLANPDLNAIFASNDEMALGAIQAITAENIQNQIFVVGFDAIDDALDAIKNGLLDATIAQQPREMGKLAVKKGIDLLNGIKIEKEIMTELKLITKSNYK